MKFECVGENREKGEKRRKGRAAGLKDVCRWMRSRSWLEELSDEEEGDKRFEK